MAARLVVVAVARAVAVVVAVVREMAREVVRVWASAVAAVIGKFWFLGQNFRCCAGAPMTQGKAKTPIPINIRGVPMPERARSYKNSHMGSPCS